MTSPRPSDTIVGFVGLGQMGKPMALNLAKAGTNLKVTSKVKEPFFELQSAGAHTFDSIDGLADAHIVFLSLPGTTAVNEVLFGERGLVTFLSPGSIVVDTSTLEHGETLKIHSQLQCYGIEFIDAPVSGMQSRAEDGTLTIMCGGRQQTFEEVMPWLQLIGNNIIYMGEAGSGQLAKLVNQLLFDINCAALAEILPMACHMGLNPEKVSAIINSGTGRSYASEFFLPRILNRHFGDGYPLQAAYKDLISAAELGARHCIPMPVLAAATATYQMSLLAGNGHSDKGGMIKLFEGMLNVKFCADNTKTEV